MTTDRDIPAGGAAGAPAELWRHPDPTSTAMYKFLEHVNKTYNISLTDYPSLYRWSVENVADFWKECWHFIGIKASRPFDDVLPANAPMFPRPDFFAGARLNFAENLLFPAGVVVDENAAAVLTASERDGHVDETSWAELRELVQKCSNALKEAGVREGSVVACFTSNHVQALVAMLSAATLGAIWTGISPDNGVSAVLDRLVQIRPQVLFADNGVLYNGKEWSSTSKTLEICEELQKNGLELVVVIRNIESIDSGLAELRKKGVKVEDFDDLLTRYVHFLPLLDFSLLTSTQLTEPTIILRSTTVLATPLRSLLQRYHRPPKSHCALSRRYPPPAQEGALSPLFAELLLPPPLLHHDLLDDVSLVRLGVSNRRQRRPLLWLPLQTALAPLHPQTSLKPAGNSLRHKRRLPHHPRSQRHLPHLRP